MQGCGVRVCSVEAFLQGRRFTVPGYQREYSWPDELVALFVDDLVNAWQGVGSVERAETEYFLGLLVTSDDGADQPLRLVDGQQRTTTLILLLKALAESGSKEIAARINALIDPSPARL